MAQGWTFLILFIRISFKCHKLSNST